METIKIETTPGGLTTLILSVPQSPVIACVPVRILENGNLSSENVIDDKADPAVFGKVIL